MGVQKQTWEDGEVVGNKARLVAQGFSQVEGLDFGGPFAPVAHLEAIRILLAFAASNGFKLYQIDVAYCYNTPAVALPTEALPRHEHSRLYRSLSHRRAWHHHSWQRCTVQRCQVRARHAPDQCARPGRVTVGRAAPVRAGLLEGFGPVAYSIPFFFQNQFKLQQTSKIQTKLNIS
jgi:hypothetical protein